MDINRSWQGFGRVLHHVLDLFEQFHIPRGYQLMGTYFIFEAQRAGSFNPQVVMQGYK